MWTSGRMSNAKNLFGLGVSLYFCGLMDLTTTMLSGSARPFTEGQEDNLSDKLHQRMKRSWVWNQFFVLEEYTGTDPLYVGKLHSDMDRGDGSIKYILSGEGAGIVFTIDDTTGDIHAIQRLDREERSQYTLRAQALDRRTGRPMEPESEFIIKIQDINDNEPKFLDGPYVASVPEMSPVGTSVIQVTATDADDPTYGNSARVVYSILQGQPYFSVDSRTGQDCSVSITSQEWKFPTKCSYMEKILPKMLSIFISYLYPWMELRSYSTSQESASFAGWDSEGLHEQD